jgi:hypothetical protein
VRSDWWYPRKTARRKNTKRAESEMRKFFSLGPTYAPHPSAAANHLSLITSHFSRLAGCRRLKPRLFEALLHITGLKGGDHIVELALHEEVQIK